jgi:hypothetical protein
VWMLLAALLFYTMHGKIQALRCGLMPGFISEPN